MHSLRVFCGLLLAAGVTFAQPSVSAVVNNASGILQGLPNAGIAQGSIFLIVGTSLGPSTVSVSPTPFQTTTLSGTSVSVTLTGGATIGVPLYYTSATQISALLPSTAAAGAATLTVSFGGQTSATASFTVVQNNPGIFTQGQNGQGAAIITNADYSLVSAAPGTGALGGAGPGTFHGAANPNDTLILWTTGLGPVSGNELAGAGLGTNMPSIPLTIWVGGVQAQVTYQGRSGCCIGEDQVVFTLPPNVPTGCAVPFFAQMGTLISNSTFIPIAVSGRTCTPSNPGLTSDAVQSLSSDTSPAYGEILVRRQIGSTLNGIQYQDVAQAAFARVTVPAATQPILPSYFDTQPLGTCTTFDTLGGTLLPYATIAGLDAGKLTLTGSSGTFTLQEKPSGGQPTVYSIVLSATGSYLSGGNYTVAAGGGNDVGPFSARFTITATPNWSGNEQFNYSTHGVTRANGATFTWTGGSPAYFVEIDGKAATDSTGNVGAGFTCLVASTAGSFTVPANILSALPASAYGEIDFKPTLTPAPFTASGLMFGSLGLNYDTSIFASFQ